MRRVHRNGDARAGSLPTQKEATVATVGGKGKGRPWLRYLFAGGMLAVVFLDGASRHFEASDPALALGFNPLNAEARFNLIVDQLNRPTSGAALARIRAEAGRGIGLAPVDARFYSLMGEARHREGRDDLAAAYYDEALRISKTEIHALTSKLNGALRARRYAEAVRDIDLILRRWPERMAEVAPLFVPILEAPSGLAAFLDVLRTDPPWRGGFIRQVAFAPGEAGLASQIVLGLQAAGGVPKRGEVATVVGTLLRANDDAEAYRLFLLTRTPAEQAKSGYVFDPGFEAEGAGRPFEWSWSSRSGYALSAKRGDRAGDEEGLVLEFFDKPVKSVNVSQMLRLPSGRFRLSLLLDGAGVVLPKGLFWSLTCGRTGKEIVGLDVPEGDYHRRELGADFSVDGEACGIEKLSLATRLVAESWQYRYRGRLLFRRLAITATGDGE